MSDTPETDAEVNECKNSTTYNMVWAEFARKLERERNEALDNNYRSTKMALEFRRELYAIKDANNTRTPEKMSDTPETDGEWNRIACYDHPQFEQGIAEFARKLERERDLWKAEAERWKEIKK